MFTLILIKVNIMDIKECKASFHVVFWVGWQWVQYTLDIMDPEMEFKEFKPRFKSAKTRFKFRWNQPYLSCGLNLNRRSNSLNSATGGMYLISSGLWTQKGCIWLVQDYGPRRDVFD